MVFGKAKKKEGESTDQQASGDTKAKAPSALKEKLGSLLSRKKSGEGAGKSAGGGPTRKFRRGERYCLFIGDDGAILVYMRGNVVLSRQFVADPSDQSLEELRQSVQGDTHAPISLIMDTIDQTYVHQTLPPVSSMSVRRLMKRRLDRDFAGSEIRGAILLGREKTGRKDWNFLMVSVEKGPELTAWLDFIYSLPNRFSGIHLASLETEIILPKLEQNPDPGAVAPSSPWKFVVTHNKVGGFRQVILRNGKIVFTRITQPIGESTPEVIAGNIEEEIQSTIEYMKRLAFDPKSGLDIYVIASGAVKPLIDKSKFAFGGFTIFTPYEVAQILGIEGATQPTDQFGDVVLAASIGSSTKNVLTLNTVESAKYQGLYIAFKAQRLAALAIFAGILVFMCTQLADIYSLYQTANETEKKRLTFQKKLDNLHADVKRDNFDLYKVTDMVYIYEALQKQKISPLAFIIKAQTVLKPPIVVKSIDWTLEDKGGEPPKRKTNAAFILEFPEVYTGNDWRKVSKQVVTDLKAALPGYDVSFAKVPNKFSETEKVDINFDAPPEQKPEKPQVLQVQLILKEL